ncbi:MAG: ketopantoate reductase family protein [Sedimentibacter sp.]|uniref:ketopantoate reductase family protein n=1 Tax=Sedimentibacter sp. TaxID=1960295 RepID=UPI0029826C3A|nr:ketopantoate reductase family protein [Sedimentibacter sp.]MDW5299867.1 ketopantoate reductase family protein [Sedimentibacter sp.]
MNIKKVALIGMGAVGTVYGNALHKFYGTDFAVISGKSRKEKLQKQGFTLNGNIFHPNIFSEGDNDIKFDLIIFCVKNYQLDEAIEDVRSFVDENTILITFLNGVTARSRIHAAYPDNKVLYGLTMRIDAERTDCGVINTVDGEIHFGEADNTVISLAVKAVQVCFDKAGIKNIVFPDMIRMIWKKFMLNVGVNQVTAVTRAPYGKVTSLETNLTLFKEAMMEVLAIAKATNIDLREEDIDDFVLMMDSFSPNGRTSMLQDVEAKRKTEVEYFAGTVIEMGKSLDIPTPINHVLYCVIKSIESLY